MGKYVLKGGFTMKRIISILLFVILIMSIIVTPAFAQENSKLEENLATALEKMQDDEKLEVWLFVVDTVDEDLVVQQTYEECGLTKETATTLEEVNLYQKTYRKIKSSFYKEFNEEVFKKFDVADEDVVFFSTMTPSFILRVSKAKVYELAQLDEVVSIGVYKLPIKPQPDHIFEAEFIEKYSEIIFSESHEYDELYYHYDKNGDMDWALVYECSYNSSPWNYHIMYKDRILMYGGYFPFSFAYGVYDAKAGEFYDILNDKFNFDDYKDLEVIFDSFMPGYPIGDADLDKDLTIMDATYIQRVLAGLTYFDERDTIESYFGYVSWNELGYPRYISDMDRDGKRTVLDATAVQRKLAKYE